MWVILTHAGGSRGAAKSGGSSVNSYSAGVKVCPTRLRSHDLMRGTSLSRRTELMTAASAFPISVPTTTHSRSKFGF